MLLWAEMVKSVSANCVSIVPNRVNSSSVNLQASALAMAVIEAVSSHEFTRDSPRVSFYDETDGICVETSATGALVSAAHQSSFSYRTNFRFRSHTARNTSFGEWM